VLVGTTDGSKRDGRSVQEFAGRTG